MTKTLGQVAKTAVRNRGNFTEALTDTDWQVAAEAVERVVVGRLLVSGAMETKEQAVIEAAKAYCAHGCAGAYKAMPDYNVLRAAVEALQGGGR